MKCAMRKELRYLFAFLSVTALLCGCIFDPQPEPDPFDKQEERESDSEEPTAGDPSDADDNGGDGTGDDGGFSQDADGAPVEGLIYCSAPGNNGKVAIVGMPGAAGSLGQTIIVRREAANSQGVVLEAASDGSFAGRIEADAGETLTITAANEQQESQPIQVVVGSYDNIDYATEFLGLEGKVNVPDASQVVEIVGEGPSLQRGIMVVGGNVTLSKGRSTLVSCLEKCRFSLFIEGRPGDEIDLFTVLPENATGLTDYQTVIVP